jgi:hypothetical protein
VGELTSRIQGIDIDAQVDGVLQPNPLPDLLDDSISADLVNLPRLDDLETAVAVVLVVRRAGKGGADTGVDVGVVFEEAFLRGVEEIGAVVDAGLFGGRTAEYFGAPCVAGQTS